MEISNEPDPLLKPCPTCKNPDPHTLWSAYGYTYCNRCGGLDEETGVSTISTAWERR